MRSPPGLARDSRGIGLLMTQGRWQARVRCWRPHLGFSAIPKCSPRADNPTHASRRGPYASALTLEEALEIVLKTLGLSGEKVATKRERSWAVRLVCSGWRRVHDSQLTHLVVKPPTPDAGVIVLVRRFPAVVTLDFKGDFKHQPKLTDEGLRAVRSLPALLCLNLTYCNKVTDKGMRAVGDLPALTSLNLSRCLELTDEGLRAVRSLPALTSLNLFCCSKVTAAGLEAVSNLPALTSLNLSHCSNMTDEGLRAVHTGLPALTFLDLRYCRTFTKAGVARLRSARPGLRVEHN